MLTPYTSSNAGQVASFTYVTTDTSITAGDVLYWTAANDLAECDGSTETCISVEAVAKSAPVLQADGSSYTVDAYPINSDTFWLADCNTTMVAATMVGTTHNLADAGIVDNHATPDTSTAGIIRILRMVKEGSDKLAIVRIERTGIVTS